MNTPLDARPSLVAQGTEESASATPRLVLFTHAITSGGAERVLTTLANAWAAKGWDVILVTLDDGQVPPFYPVDPLVCQVKLAVSRRSAAGQALAEAGADRGVLRWLMRSKLATLWNLSRRALRVRHGLMDLDPDLVISFIDQVNILTLVALAGSGIPVIVSERIDPAHHRIGWAWSALRVMTYPWADRLVVQGEGIQKQFHGRVRRRSRVIPNPVICAPVHAVPADTARTGRTLVAVGRLVPQKGFDMLLKAFARLTPEHPDWKLVIWGEGPERPVLEQLRTELGLEECSTLPGNHPRIYEALAESDLFVLSSRFEGFPNALCEAMATGLPVVSFDCPSGPAQIIRPGLDGFLIPLGDQEALVQALGRLMADASLRASMGARAREVVDRFSLGQILGLWEACIAEVWPPKR
ncbi:glycosyl transferase [Geothrix oryzae]|uniref:Glycosyl transferase n=1 Tax=Geothrix oryzae TaxID=2927975 RepID=A0ABN6UYC1_9BACT|nr:glycosyltransferase family 4 protein [Geothrix oryzae]BDU70056.1 glycosyl transferase [Geothrix oryzae]